MFSKGNIPFVFKYLVPVAGRVRDGWLPVAGHEVIDARARELERVMLGIRMREGLELAGPGGGAADGGGRGRTPEHLVPVVARLVADGLLQPGPALRSQILCNHTPAYINLFYALRS